MNEPDYFHLYAVEVLGCPVAMRWREVAVVGDMKAPRAQTCFRIVLAAPPDVFLKSGKNKGEPDWRKRDKSLDREFIVPFSKFDAFVAKKKLAASPSVVSEQGISR